jgi:hypothetical protein
MKDSLFEVRSGETVSAEQLEKDNSKLMKELQTTK